MNENKIVAAILASAVYSKAGKAGLDSSSGTDAIEEIVKIYRKCLEEINIGANKGNEELLPFGMARQDFKPSWSSGRFDK